jgi:DNA-binding transcriptional MerR regulator
MAEHPKVLVGRAILVHMNRSKGRPAPDAAGFSSTAAARLAKITYRQLDHWATTGLVAPSLARARPGTGNRRRYSFTDVVVMRTAGELRRAGVSLQSIRKVVAELKLLKNGSELSQARLIVDGNDVIVVVDESTALSVLRKPGQGVLRLVLDLGEVVSELRQGAADLPPASAAGEIS